MTHRPEWAGDSAPALLWTAMPVELVLGGLTSEVSAPLEIRQGSRVLQVDPQGDGTGAVRRLISSDPADYLDPRWQPGAIVPVTTA